MGEGNIELTNHILLPRVDPQYDDIMVAKWSDEMQHVLVGATVGFWRKYKHALGLRDSKRANQI